MNIYLNLKYIFYFQKLRLLFKIINFIFQFYFSNLNYKSKLFYLKGINIFDLF